MADMQYPSTDICFGQNVAVGLICRGRRTDIVNCTSSRHSAPEYACLRCMGVKLIVYTDTFSHEATYCADRSDGHTVDNDSQLACGVPLLGA
jgi:hypothetical protein